MVTSVTIEDAGRNDLSLIEEIVSFPDRIAVRMRLAIEGHEDLLVARVDGTVRGVTSIRWTDGCDAPHPWLYGTEVHRAFRGQGIGSAMWADAERRCLAAGANAASLDVDVDNPDALRLYERLGYRIVRRHVHHWRDLEPKTGAVRSEGDTDTWLLRKRLMPCRSRNSARLGRRRPSNQVAVARHRRPTALISVQVNRARTRRSGVSAIEPSLTDQPSVPVVRPNDPVGKCRERRLVDHVFGSPTAYGSGTTGTRVPIWFTRQERWPPSDTCRPPSDSSTGH